MNQGERQGSIRKDVEIATLGGGCFWCTEAVFTELKGMEKVESGYSGGVVPNPTYEQVCTGKTGHAEVIQITFDPEVISYRDILRVFFAAHDPTTPNRQGSDIGPQYRSIILYHDEDQREAAEQVIKEVNESGTWKRPVVTELVPFNAFYRAEDYHQEYYERNPEKAYCRVVITPKLAKIRKRYRDRLKNR
ncbi:peptide-methionine (S)-S-oxide reductase MsrA [[Eubacterium] cellulosolvens]